MADRFYSQQTDYIYQLNQLNDFVMSYTGGGGGSYVLPVASSSTSGGIKVGANLTMTAGVLSADAAPQLQADWNEPSSSSKAYILNKPTVNPLSMTAAWQTFRDFPLGTLVTTDLPATDLTPFLLEISGNSYGLLVPIDVKVQGYPYAGALINTGGLSNGQGIPGLVAFALGGVLCFWWPTQGYWLGYHIFASQVGYAAGYRTNRVTNVTNAAKPTTGVTMETTITIRQSLHTGSHPNVENKSSATIRGELTSSNVVTALTYDPARVATVGFLAGGSFTFTLGSITGTAARTLANPATGIGYAGGARVRFSNTNDVDTTLGFSDVIDLSTYVDSTGGGVNSLYLRKDLQQIRHKFAGAGATAWTEKILQYTDGTGATGTWGISVSGNAATATKMLTNRGNYKGTNDTDVAGELMWKNYGNGHTIFDASASTNPVGGACSNTDPTNVWTPTYPTLMGYNGTNTYGVRVDTARLAETVSRTTVETGLAGTLNLAATATPTLYLSDTDAGTNLGRWGMQVPNGGDTAILGPATDAGVVTAALTLKRNGTVTAAGTFVTQTVTGYRMKSAAGTTGRALLHVIDTSNYYQLLTANNDADGTFNTLRPYYVNLSSGDVTMGQGMTVVGACVLSGGVAVTGAAAVTGTFSVTGASQMGNLVNLTGTAPFLSFDETDQGGVAGRWGINATLGGLAFYRNTAVARDFSTAVADLNITSAGIVQVATAALGTSTTQAANTAFVIGQAATATPLANGTAAVGTATTFARADHVHADSNSMKLLAAVNITAVTTIDFLTLFTSAYDSYVIEILGAMPSSAGTGLCIRWAVGGTVITASTDYLYPSTFDWTMALDNSQSYLPLTGSVANTGVGATSRVELLNANSTKVKLTPTQTVADSGTWVYSTTWNLGFKNTGTVSGFRVFWTGGNFQAVGTIRVYGRKNS